MNYPIKSGKMSRAECFQCVYCTTCISFFSPHAERRLGQPYCKMGANNGMVVLLDAETYDYASSPATSAEGFTLSLLHHLV